MCQNNRKRINNNKAKIIKVDNFYIPNAFYSICQITTDRFVFNSIENKINKSPEKNKKRDWCCYHALISDTNSTENYIQMISNLEYTKRINTKLLFFWFQIQKANKYTQIVRKIILPAWYTVETFSMYSNNNNSNSDLVITFEWEWQHTNVIAKAIGSAIKIRYFKKTERT